GEEKGAGELPVSVPTRLLAVDYGTVRIGLAISDTERKLAFPMATYVRGNREHDAKHFQALVTDEGIGEILLGLPVHLSGQEGQKARETRAFGKWLAEATGIPG